MKKFIAFIALISSVLLSAAAVGAAPEELWTVLNAEPGDAAMICGDNFANVSGVMIYRLPDSDVSGSVPQYIRTQDPGELVTDDENPRRVQAPWDAGAAVSAEILSHNADGVQFAVPESLPFGVYEVKALSNDGETEPLFINRPKIKWAQGDEGTESSPGGWMRVCGRNLSAHDGTVILAMENEATGDMTYLQPEKIYDAYSIEYKIPESMAAGKYRLYAHNGFGGANAWSHPLEYEIISKTVWKQATFNVQDYGAVGDGKTNDTFAVYEALKAAEKNNGGIVYFPRGRYYITSILNIPRYTTLKGESNKRTQIFWNDEQWDIGEVPDYLIYGKDNFAIEDIDFRGGRSKCIVQSDAYTPTAGNVFIRNCYFSFCSIAKRVEVSGNGNGMEYFSRLAGEQTGGVFMISVGGKNVEVSNNYIYGSYGSMLITNPEGAVIRNNLSHIQLKGWNAAAGAQKIIVEDNVFIGQGMGFNTLFKTNGVSDVYYARNDAEQVFLNDREVITTDGGESLFFGKPLGVSGTTVLMPENKSNLVNDAYVNYACLIVSGKGKGQYRKIVSNTKNSVELLSPFSIEPDNTSNLVILKDMSYMYFVDNKLGEASNFQMYGLSFESVLDSNHFNKTNGIRALSGFIYKTVQPNYYIYIANNTLEGGWYYHWYGIEEMDNWSGMVHIALDSSSNEEAYYHYGDVVRNNDIRECGRIKVHGTTVENTLSNVIVDHNRIENNAEGISVKGAVNNILLYRNQFEQVDEPYKMDDTAAEEGRVTIK